MAKRKQIDKPEHFAMTRFCVGCGERIRREFLKFNDLFKTWRCPCCRRVVKGVEKCELEAAQ